MNSLPFLYKLGQSVSLKFYNPIKGGHGGQNQRYLGLKDARCLSYQKWFLTPHHGMLGYVCIKTLERRQCQSPEITSCSRQLHQFHACLCVCF